MKAIEELRGKADNVAYFYHHSWHGELVKLSDAESLIKKIIEEIKKEEKEKNRYHKEELHNRDLMIDAMNGTLAEQKEMSNKYHELIFAVQNKHPNETRHETALRYIKQAELSHGTGEAKQAIKGESNE